jgi:Ca2+-binding RTX toxin-like protein
MANSVYIPSGLGAELVRKRPSGDAIPQDTLLGGSGADVLIGGAGHQALYGGDGNDYLDGGAGDDLMVGGSGNDTFVVSDAGDSIVEAAGGGGEDWVWVKLERVPSFAPMPLTYVLPDNVENAAVSGPLDFLYGNGLDNTLDLGKVQGQIEVHGNGGDDLIIVGDAVRVLAFGGDGSNVIHGGALGGVLVGGEEQDRLYGSSGWDGLEGNGGNDWLFGGSGDDYLRGGGGENTLYAGSGWDNLALDAGKNLAFGGDGNDNLFHGPGDDTAYGGRGDDWFLAAGKPGGLLVGYGGSGSDRFVLDAPGGALTAYGGSGTDSLQGGGGGDLLHGDAGDDHLFTSHGLDTFYGGAGADSFRLFQPGEAAQVMDFSRTEGDVVDLRQFIQPPVTDPFAEGFVDLKEETDGDGTKVIVYVDADGGGDGFKAAFALRGVSLGGLTGTDWLQYD